MGVRSLAPAVTTLLTILVYLLIAGCTAALPPTMVNASGALVDTAAAESTACQREADVAAPKPSEATWRPWLNALNIAGAVAGVAGAGGDPGMSALAISGTTVWEDTSVAEREWQANWAAAYRVCMEARGYTTDPLVIRRRGETRPALSAPACATGHYRSSLTGRCTKIGE